MMDCALVMDLLPNLLDDELTEELSEQVQAHLIGCRRCAWEVESLRQSAAALRTSSAHLQPSAEFRERLLDELLRDHRAAAARRPHRALPLWQQEPRRIFVLEDNDGQREA